MDQAIAHPILYVDKSDDSRYAAKILGELAALKEAGMLVDLNMNKAYNLPAFEYGSGVIQGLDQIIALRNNLRKGKKLEDLIKLKDQGENKKVNPLKKDERVIAALLGYTVGGVWIYLLSNTLRNLTFTYTLVALFIPAIIVLGWPWIWPYLKKELRNWKLRGVEK